MNIIFLNLHHYLVVIIFSVLILLPTNANAALIDIKFPKPDSCSMAVVLQGDSEVHAYDNGGNTVIFYLRHSFSENIGAPWGFKACSVFIPSLNEYRYGYSYRKSIPAGGCSDNVYDTTLDSCAIPCVAGKVRNSITNRCELVPEVCPDGTFTGHISAGSAPSTICVGGCQATIISASNQFAVSGAQVIAGTWEYVGGEKLPSCMGTVATVGDLAELSEAPNCQASECLGQVNGQWVCVDCSQAATPNTIYDVGETTTTDASGTTSTTRDQETSLGPAGVTQITTITNSNASGIQTTQTISEVFSQDNFCQNNPKSLICKDAKDTCVDNPDLVGCIKLGAPTDTNVVGESNIDVSSITPIGICPPDVRLPLGFNFSWQGICDGADMLRPIVLVLALLAAGFIIIRAFKRG